MKDNNINREVPLGFGMELIKNEKAMKYFAALSDNQQQEVLHKAGNITSKTEMKNFVNGIGEM